MFTRRLLQLFGTQRIEAPRKFSETFSRHRNVMDLYNLKAFNEGFIFIAPNATVVGDIWMGNNISIWHGTVIRGDINRVTLSHNISIGNNCVLHTAASSPTGLGAELFLQGNNIIQNNCTLYSCRIEKGAYVGHNSVVMEGAILQRGAIVAPNSVVPPGRVVKERQVWGGNPIKYIRKALEQEAFVTFDYTRYATVSAQDYTSAFLPYGNAYLYRHGPSEPIDKHISVNQYDQWQTEQEAYNPSESTINRYN